MTLARILLKLWKMRLLIALGAVLAGAAAVASFTTTKTTVYSTASTQMLIDSPDSALVNANADMGGYLARADVLASVMVSNEAVNDIGGAAGIPGNLIDATGPVQSDGAAQETHLPTATVGGGKPISSASYKLDLVQNPELPTIDVYTEAPTTKQAIALANGAVTGLATFATHWETGNNIPADARIIIRQLGAATGGVVDPSASKMLAAIIFCAILALWCGVLLFFSMLRDQLRVARSESDDLLRAASQQTVPLPGPGATEIATGYKVVMRPRVRGRLASGNGSGGEEDHGARRGIGTEDSRIHRGPGPGS